MARELIKNTQAQGMTHYERLSDVMLWSFNELPIATKRKGDNLKDLALSLSDHKDRGTATVASFLSPPAMQNDAKLTG